MAASHARASGSPKSGRVVRASFVSIAMPADHIRQQTVEADTGMPWESRSMMPDGNELGNTRIACYMSQLRSTAPPLTLNGVWTALRGLVESCARSPP